MTNSNGGHAPVVTPEHVATNALPAGGGAHALSV
jgi:hypothetical protein